MRSFVSNVESRYLNIYVFISFMIELIKRKQDDVITKSVIRARKLDQSMLRFARIYRDENGDLLRDNDSEVYSRIMQESENQILVIKIVR